MKIRLTALLIGVAVMAACSADSGTGVLESTASVGGSGGRDSSTTQARPDTGRAPFTGVSTVRGTVYTLKKNTGGGTDTLKSVPVAGIHVKLYHNVLQNGASASILIAETASAVDGSFSFSSVPGGYYLVRTDAVTGTWGAGLAYLNVDAAQVNTTVYIGAPAPDSPIVVTDSTRKP